MLDAVDHELWRKSFCEISWLRNHSYLSDTFVIETSKIGSQIDQGQSWTFLELRLLPDFMRSLAQAMALRRSKRCRICSNSIDTSGSGSITQSQFEQAFQTKNPPAVFQKQGADAIFASLDPAGTGSVSKQDFVSTMSKLMASLRADNSTSNGSSPANSLTTSLQALNQINPADVPPTAPPGTLINHTA